MKYSTLFLSVKDLQMLMFKILSESRVLQTADIYSVDPGNSWFLVVLIEICLKQLIGYQLFPFTNSNYFSSAVVQCLYSDEGICWPHGPLKTILRVFVLHIPVELSLILYFYTVCSLLSSALLGQSYVVIMQFKSTTSIFPCGEFKDALISEIWELTAEQQLLTHLNPTVVHCVCATSLPASCL